MTESEQPLQVRRFEAELSAVHRAACRYQRRIHFVPGERPESAPGAFVPNAAANEEAIVISLGLHHSFPLAEVKEAIAAMRNGRSEFDTIM